MLSQEEFGQTWWHIGRFFYSFAILESEANELFEKLFNLGASAFILIVPQLELSKKVELITLALKRQGIEARGLAKAVNAIVEVRNIVAHTSFGPAKQSDNAFESNRDYENGLRLGIE